MTCGPHRTHRARSGRHHRHRASGRPGAGRARRYGARHDPLGAHRAPRTSPRETGRLDITAPASVRRGATTARDTVDRLDMLVRCAGIMATPFRPSADGHELILATDSLGPVFLTHELLLHRAGRRRVVRAGSPEAVLGSIDLVDLNRQCNLRWMVGCRQSRLADVMVAIELDERATAAEPTFTRWLPRASPDPGSSRRDCGKPAVAGASRSRYCWRASSPSRCRWAPCRSSTARHHLTPPAAPAMAPTSKGISPITPR